MHDFLKFSCALFFCALLLVSTDVSASRCFSDATRLQKHYDDAAFVGVLKNIELVYGDTGANKIELTAEILQRYKGAEDLFPAGKTIKIYQEVRDFSFGFQIDEKGAVWEAMLYESDGRLNFGNRCQYEQNWEEIRKLQPISAPYAELLDKCSRENGVAKWQDSHFTCAYPAKDAGKSCYSSRECDGVCEIEITEAQSGALFLYSGPEAEILKTDQQGKCSAWKNYNDNGEADLWSRRNIGLLEAGSIRERR